MVRSLVLAALFVAAAAPSPPPPARTVYPAARGYWLQPVPGNDLEAAVHAIVTDPAVAGTPQAAHALRDLAAQHPEAATAGLARLAAGLILLDHQQYAEAEPLLADAEIPKTHLEDHAWKALAELYEKTGDFTKAAEHYDKLVARPDPNPFRCTALLRGAEVHDQVVLVQRVGQISDVHLEGNDMHKLSRTENLSPQRVGALPIIAKRQREHPEILSMVLTCQESIASLEYAGSESRNYRLRRPGFGSGRSAGAGRRRKTAARRSRFCGVFKLAETDDVH